MNNSLINFELEIRLDVFGFYKKIKSKFHDFLMQY